MQHLSCHIRRLGILPKQNFKNLKLTARSFAIHHWSHTWLGEVYDWCLVKVSDIVARAKARELANSTDDSNSKPDSWGCKKEDWSQNMWAY